MKLVTVHRALKELQNIVFPPSCLVQAPYLVKFPLRNFNVPLPDTLSICICIYDNIRYSLAKRISFCSSFKALSTDTSFIEIGVSYQRLSILEFNFHYLAL